MDNFVQQYLAGNVDLEDIDTFIERWHTTPDGCDVSIHEYLGLTWSEYLLFVSSPKDLEFICERYRNV